MTDEIDQLANIPSVVDRTRRLEAGAPIVAAPSPEVTTVEIIRGDKRTHESVRQE